MKNALGYGLVDALDSSLQHIFFILCACRNGDISLFDCRVQWGFDGFVAQSLRCTHFNTLFGGFNIWHGDTSFFRVVQAFTKIVKIKMPVNRSATRSLPHKGGFTLIKSQSGQIIDRFGDLIVFKHALITSTAYCNIYQLKMQYLFDSTE
jgi:hypothetical protein